MGWACGEGVSAPAVLPGADPSFCASLCCSLFPHVQPDSAVQGELPVPAGLGWLPRAGGC